MKRKTTNMSPSRLNLEDERTTHGFENSPIWNFKSVVVNKNRTDPKAIKENENIDYEEFLKR